ncbi:MAG: thiamine pyrophosphate-dependent enzyme [Candidatus Geothermarchaeales archaeon]
MAYAKSFGIHGYRVEEASDLASILEEVLERREPGVVDVPVDYSENMTLTERLGSLICPI